MINKSAVSDLSDAELPTKTAILDNKIAKGDYELANDIPLKCPIQRIQRMGMTGIPTEREILALEKHRGKANFIILG